MSTNSFKPHPLIRGGNLQTILGHIGASQPLLKADEILRVRLPDEDEIALDMNYGVNAEQDTAVIMLCHGLGGSANSSYMIRIATKLTLAGFRVARFNHRGCDMHGFPAKQIYHSGSTADLKASMAAVHARWPRALLIVVGFSLSGAILLNLLGREPEIGNELSNLRKAIAICPPIDLEQSSQAVSMLKNRHYDAYYTKGLLNTAQKRRERFPEGINPTLPRKVNLRIFDELFTAKLGGFRDRSHYYESCSPRNVVGNIKLETTVIVAADDPIVPMESVTKAEFSDRVRLHIESSGGHMGFIAAQRLRFGDFRWMDDAVVKLVERTLG